MPGISFLKPDEQLVLYSPSKISVVNGPRVAAYMPGIIRGKKRKALQLSETEYAKIKNYDEAYAPWMGVRKECPSLNVAIFSYGERILKDRIKKATPETIDAETADLMKLYDEWLKNFPTKKNDRL